MKFDYNDSGASLPLPLMIDHAPTPFVSCYNSFAGSPVYPLLHAVI